MFKLKKIGALSLGYVQAVFGAVLGLIVTVLNLIASLYLSSRPDLKAIAEIQLGLTTSFSYWSFLIVPALYAIIGFVFGIAAAAIYNQIVVPVTKGLILDLEK